MQFLSIAGRELRVAARKRSSYRVRILAAGVALFMSGFSLWFVTLFGERPISGEQLFWGLSWASFICGCVVGPALTADCVNQERNDGTLGLLFLTNIRTVSLALGKLAGQGVLALYSIVAIFPVMTLPMLLGGGDWESLTKTALVLFVTVVLSLTIGMFASTVCERPWRAAALSVVIMALLVVGLPVTVAGLRATGRVDWLWLEWLSPSYSLSMASPSAAMLPSNQFWMALGAELAIALTFFTLIIVLLPRVWKEGGAAGWWQRVVSIWKALEFGPTAARTRLRRRLLGVNPVLWLSARERFGPMGFALVLLALACVISRIGQYLALPPDDFLKPMVAWVVGMPLLYMCFCFRLATAASERFATDRKAGALELIVCTPIRTREIIRGHWLGLMRRFWGAGLVLLSLHLFVLNYIMEAIRLEMRRNDFGFREVIASGVRHLVRGDVISNETAPFYIACLAVMAAAMLIVILWIALGWLGMALALKMRREILAPWLSLLVLAVPPIVMFVCIGALLDNKKLFATNLFLAMLSMGASGFSLVLLNALFWLFLARRWVYRTLREVKG